MWTRWKGRGLAFAVAVAILYAFPHYPKIHHANELPRIYLTMAIVDSGTVAIDDGVERWGATADVSRWRGHHYSNKAPGQSFVVVPVYAGMKAILGEPSLGQMTWAFRVFGAAVPTLLFLVLLWRFLARYAPDPDVRRLVVVSYALGTMVLIYSVQFMSHHLAAVCIGTGWIVATWVAEGELGDRWMLAAGAAAGAAPLVDYQAAFAGVPVAIYIAWRLLAPRAGDREPTTGDREPTTEDRGPRTDDRGPTTENRGPTTENRGPTTEDRGRASPRLRPIAFAILGAIPPIALLLLYHWAAFDSPLRTGYDASETFAHFHQKGFLGMDRLRAEAFVGSTVAADNGLVFLSPILLAAIPGWVLMFRQRRIAPAATTLAVAVIYLLFISSINFWRGGWQVGPRYVTAMLPFLTVPIAAAATWAHPRWPWRGALVGLAAVSIAIYALTAIEFPHFPEVFRNPFFEVTLRLVGDGYAADTVLSPLGITGAAALVPYVLLIAAIVVTVALPTRGHWKSAALALVVAGAVLSAYAAHPGGGPAADATYERVKAKF